MSRVIKHTQCPRCFENGRDTRGDNLAVYDDDSAHCFSCKYHRFPKYYVPKQKELNGPKSLLPADFTREVPTNAWKWLLQYDLGYSYWKEKVGYAPSEERLIFLVGEPLQFSIGRFIGHESAGAKSDPRYVGPPVDGKQPKKWYVYGDSHRHCEAIGTGDSIVLVEDLVSAHKVGQVTTAVPLFGTDFHPCHVFYLRMAGKPVYLWLDKDQEGTVAKKATRLQVLIQQPVNVIITEKDPKCLSKEQINENL